MIFGAVSRRVLGISVLTLTSLTLVTSANAPVPAQAAAFVQFYDSSPQPLPLEQPLLVPVAHPDNQFTVSPSQDRQSGFAPGVERRDYRLRSGDTLMSVLLDAGAARKDADRAIRALGKAIKLTRLQIGQEIQVFVDRSERRHPATLVGVSVVRAEGRAVLAFRDFSGKYKTEKLSSDAAQELIDSIVTVEDQDSGDQQITRDVTLRRGDTLISILVKAGADRGDAMRALRALGKRLNLKRLQIGQRISVTFERDKDSGMARLSGVAVHRKRSSDVAVWRDGTGKFGHGDAPKRTANTDAPSDPPSDASETAAPAAPALTQHRITLRKGDILLRRITALGADRQSADRAAKALGKLVNMRRLQIGQAFIATFAADNPKRLLGLSYVKRNGSEIAVHRARNNRFAKGAVDAGQYAVAAQTPVKSKAADATKSPEPTAPAKVEAQATPTAAPAKAETQNTQSQQATETAAKPAPAAATAANTAAPAPRSPLTGDSAVVMMVGRGDTFYGLMTDAGVQRKEAVKAAKSMRRIFNPSRLKVGQKMVVAVRFEGSTVHLNGLVLETGRNKSVVVVNTSDKGFVARKGKGADIKDAIAAADTIGEQDSPPVQTAYQQALSQANIDPAQIAADASVQQKSVTLGKGDTLMKAMLDAGCTSSDANAAIRSAKAHLDVRKLKPGMDFALLFADDHATDDKALALMTVDLNPEARLEVVRLESGKYLSGVVAKRLTPQLRRAEGVIGNNLYSAAQDAGLPHDTMLQLIKIFSYDIDFQRDIQSGDGFEILYQQMVDEDGNYVRTGPILFATMKVSGTALSLYRYEVEHGYTDYFDETGQSVRKALMRTPIDGARLTSRFGMRRHPIQGYNKMHRGVDFAAPRGTPIFAAGDGVVEKAARFSSYGNYIRIRHSADYKTAYAHLRKFAKGVYPGKRVKQGQVIGYVGSTGRSTGPHLHYEVLRRGKQVNPLSVKLPAGEKLGGQTLTAFQSERARLEKLYAGLQGPTRVAEDVPVPSGLSAGQ